jgi:hypothetical protein
MFQHSPITRFISRMPFEGKKLVTARYRIGLQAIRLGDREGRDREVRALQKFSAKHYMMAGVAAAVAMVNTFHAVRTGSAVHGIEAAYDAGFATAYYGAGCVQARMARHLGSHHVPKPYYARSQPIPGINTAREYDVTPTWYQTLCNGIGNAVFALTTYHALRPDAELPLLPPIPGLG